ncbi:hypothetical protein ACIO93_02775 [Streptomyces sp. NPDC087903]|uniref:hypothetical protein n=1 Tax=Streptomyces sp. NPDC087903 TaxID=3365819 RepID=UPI00380FABDE
MSSPDDLTQRLGDEPRSAVAAHTPEDEYSATVLGSHWFQRPEANTTLVEEPTAGTPSTPPTLPDRVEGTLLRFGPGVTGAVAHRSHTTLPVVRTPAPLPRRDLRRHALPLLVLIAVLAFLAWHRSVTGLTVDEVTVASGASTVRCDGTVDLVGVITTNGRPGTLTYRWVRSDGTTSGVLREVLPSGRKHARVHLLWTFEGKGLYRARATLRVLSPTEATAGTRFTYACR